MSRWVSTVSALLVTALLTVATMTLLAPGFSLLSFAHDGPKTSASSNDGPLVVVSAPQPIDGTLNQVSPSSSSFYYVGAQASVSSTGANQGIQSNIQVVAQSAQGCLSYWVSEASTSRLWGQVGYREGGSCGSSPSAFWQVWNLNTTTYLAGGASSVSSGQHLFAMFLQSGNTWAFAVDGTVIGSFDLQGNHACTCYPMFALSEEGYVSAPYVPSQQVQFAGIQAKLDGVWSSLATSVSYGTSWGVAGNIQDLTVPADAATVGGNTSPLPSGTSLWSMGAGNTVSSTTFSSTSTTSSSTSTITSTSTSTSTTSSLTSTTASTSTTSTVSTSTSLSTSSSLGHTLLIALSILPTTTTPKSTVYFSVLVTSQLGSPVAGAAVTLTVTNPNGRVNTVSGTTNSAGQAFFKYTVSAAAPAGTYSVSTLASLAGSGSATAGGTFFVA